MCEFCVQHGEGKKWYLQAKNYSKELLNEERKRFMTDFFQNFEQDIREKVGALDKLVAADPTAARALFPAVVEQQKKEHWGQVIPFEDVEQIIDMSLSLVRVPCVCRSTLRGFRDARFCFGITSFQSDYMPVADNLDFSSDIEVLDKEEARKAIQKLDRNGLVHTVWTFITPLIFGLCNCTVNECMALKTRTRFGLPTLFKAEYVASIDWEKCNGCRNCMKLCNFGAISYSAYAGKCSVDQRQCFGCRVCRAVCRPDAVTLTDRNAIPALVNEW